MAASTMTWFTHFFAAVENTDIMPVKLKVKSVKYDGQEIKKNIKDYFAGRPEDYEALYDAVVLELEEIEDLSGSAKSLTANTASIHSPDRSSKISVSDLIGLVNDKYQ